MTFIPISLTNFTLPFLLALLISLLISLSLVRLGGFLALDRPGAKRLHRLPVPRIGGIAFWLAFVLVLPFFVQLELPLFGFLIGLTFIFLLGLVDDFVQLPAFYKLTGQILGALILVLFGIGIHSLTNPFGGVFLLPFWLDSALTIIWVVMVVNALNFLDGLDGLAGSVSFVAALVLGILSLLIFVAQPSTATINFIVAGAILGFLFLNFHPARLFMGDSGSHFLGYVLATLAIISGGKIATAALVLGVPLIDFFWALIRRTAQGRSPVDRDLEHLHHRLLHLGLSQIQVVWVFVLLSLLFGSLALLGGTWFKLIAFSIAILLVTLFMTWLSNRRFRSGST